MTQALERVIAEQQEKIDYLQGQIDSNNKSLRYQYQKEQEMMKLLDGVVDLRIKCETEEHHKTWHDYRHKIRLYMMERGWCFNCGSFNCECHYDD